MTLIVDASALAAILFSEPEDDFVAEQLSGWRLAAPMLLPHELASVGLKKVRRFDVPIEDVMRALGNFERMAVMLHEVPAGDVVALAIATGLSAYDASYLWLSRDLDAPLVTLDGKLAKAAAG